MAICPNFKDYVEIASDTIVGISALAAAVFAFMGVSTWRKQLKGKSEYERAKETLKSVYRVREAFRHVRAPYIFSSEYPEDLRDHHGSLKKEFEHKGMVAVYEARWKVLAEAFHELEEKALEAQVEWGPEFENVIMPLRQCRSELLVTIQIMLERTKAPEDFEPISREESQKERAILYQVDDSKYDFFTPKINAAISEFETKLRPHIGK